MIESGINTKEVELFTSINIKLDGTDANNLLEALAELFDKDILKILDSEKEETVEKLLLVLTTAVEDYKQSFDDNDEFIGEL